MAALLRLKLAISDILFLQELCILTGNKKALFWSLRDHLPPAGAGCKARAIRVLAPSGGKWRFSAERGLLPGNIIKLVIYDFIVDIQNSI